MNALNTVSLSFSGSPILDEGAKWIALALAKRTYSSVQVNIRSCGVTHTSAGQIGRKLRTCVIDSAKLDYLVDRISKVEVYSSRKLGQDEPYDPQMIRRSYVDAANLTPEQIAAFTARDMASLGGFKFKPPEREQPRIVLNLVPHQDGISAVHVDS